ncbi:GIY-YIG nuclease family protein [Yoonia maritima]|uniref:GIY-YIG nuclease family protein n=1 Tax=Yoonia maritima TaxID=1435347 RepID=UPI000D0FAA37|nr:GIY-YIG nuclease family protein [Yoonia maritima]
MNRLGRSLELFFVDGRADGMLTAEVFGWTGHVLRAPRTQIKDALMRPEAGFTGVYVLLGETKDGPLAYIGEAEDMRVRLRDHVSNKGWWDDAILISSAANNLHKAHIKYLESRLVEIARDVAHTTLENGNTPPRSSLNEAAQANMESFIDTLMMVLPAIRVDLFLQKKVTAVLQEQPDTSKASDVGESWPPLMPAFQLTTRSGEILAYAKLQGGEFIVQHGSKARITVGKSSTDGVTRKRQQLLNAHTIIENDGWLEFVDNYSFQSPSGAADFINGYSTNGRISWKEVKTGKTFAEWEQASIDSGMNLI